MKKDGYRIKYREQCGLHAVTNSSLYNCKPLSVITFRIANTGRRLRSDCPLFYVADRRRAACTLMNDGNVMPSVKFWILVAFSCIQKHLTSSGYGCVILSNCSRSNC